MITEQAVVTRRDGARVEVRLLRESACGGCELGMSCGTGAIGRLLGSRSRPLRIECGAALEPGDRVELQLSESDLARASLTLYGVPLVGMLAAGLAAALGGLPELAVAAVSVAGLYLGFRLASRLAARLDRAGVKPRVVDAGVKSVGGPGSLVDPRIQF